MNPQLTDSQGYQSGDPKDVPVFALPGTGVTDASLHLVFT